MTRVSKTKKVPLKRFKDEDFLKSVGSRIQDIMAKKKITHEDFYIETQINPHRIIIGKINMTLSTFSRICKYLEISPENFFKGIKD